MFSIAHDALPQFVYLAPYERAAKGRISADTELAFELAVIANPTVGAVIPGSGGLRKVRIALAGGGKRGGARFIYHRRAVTGRVYVFTVYVKSAQADLSPTQARLLRQILSDLE